MYKQNDTLVAVGTYIADEQDSFHFKYFHIGLDDTIGLVAAGDTPHKWFIETYFEMGY